MIDVLKRDNVEIKKQMIINRGSVRVSACVRVVIKPVQLCAPKLKLLGEEKRGSAIL